jgi:putative ABC transport system substrate-binding protein
MAGRFALRLRMHFNVLGKMNRAQMQMPVIFKMFFTCVFVLWTTASVVSAIDLHIAVFVGHKEAPYKEVLAGFQKYLTEQKISAIWDVYIIESDIIQISKIYPEIKKNKPRLIFAVGTTSTVEVLKTFVDVPVVATLILDEGMITRARNATGVILDFPIETQFSWLKSILPETKTIGVIYNPAENKEKIQLAKVIAGKMGLDLNPVPVYTPKDIPNALKVLVKNADILWGINDTLVFNPLTAKQILLFSFRNQIPFCGPSSTWAKAGALCSLEYDFLDIGAQCGEKAIEIIRGAKATSVPLSFPRKFLYTLNLRTANRMKITFQEKDIRAAHQVFD